MLRGTLVCAAILNYLRRQRAPKRHARAERIGHAEGRGTITAACAQDDRSMPNGRNDIMPKGRNHIAAWGAHRNDHLEHKPSAEARPQEVPPAVLRATASFSPPSSHSSMSMFTQRHQCR